MKRHRLGAAVLLALTVCLLTTQVFALELTVNADSSYCFSADHFTAVPEDEGIFVTSVPTENVATIRYGNRIIRPGDALPMDALDELELDPASASGQSAVISYYTVSGGHISAAKELRLSIMPQKNEPPIADSTRLETYKNIANSGKLKASDPEGGTLTFQVVKEPKRGSVVIESDGSFTYTPMENKVGKDSFLYTVTDEAGNVSEPAKVFVEIKKPENKASYADMRGDRDEYAAMWMKDAGLFTGAHVGGNLCFDPDASVSRGDFLVMVMHLVEARTDDALSVSGFADEEQTDLWMRPYIAAALSNGMISGTADETGLVFRPNDILTGAEAVVMLQNVLELPAADAAAVFSDDTANTIPAWAQKAAAALAGAGITMDRTANTDPLTRRDAACLLLQVNNLLESDVIETFYWAE